MIVTQTDEKDANYSCFSNKQKSHRVAQRGKNLYLFSIRTFLEDLLSQSHSFSTTMVIYFLFQTFFSTYQSMMSTSKKHQKLAVICLL